MENYYEILGLSSHADKNEIKKAYHILVKKYHPDSHRSKEFPDADEKFKLVKEAYETLIDDELKKSYDKYVLKVPSRLFKGQEITRAKRSVEFYERGIELYRAKKFHFAGRMFQTALNLDKDNPLYCSWLGLALSNTPSELKYAKKWCEKAIKLSPYEPDYYINLAIIYRDAGIKSMAEKLLRKALKLDPNNRRACSWLKEKKFKPSFKSRVKKIFGRKKK